MRVIESLWDRVSILRTRYDLEWISKTLPVSGSVPGWFNEGGNLLFAAPGTYIPPIDFHPGVPLPRNAIVVLGHNINIGSLMIWGEGAHVIICDDVSLPASTINCGGGSTIYIGPKTYAGANCVLNARNGGSIAIDGDGLWSEAIRIVTDDMHAIRDQTSGKRLNPFGGKVWIGTHVWLCMDVLILPGAEVHPHSIIGARGVVTGVIPANTVAAGAPAKVVRCGVTWSRDDLP